MALEDLVDNQEELYRSLKVGFHCKKENGKWRTSSQAFTDRYQKPSVDRARLRNNLPAGSKINETDGVVSILAIQARETRIHDYVLDVVPKPIFDHETIADNPAHAEIIADRPYENDKFFRKIIERLGKLAEERGWLIEPTDLHEN